MPVAVASSSSASSASSSAEDPSPTEEPSDSGSPESSAAEETTPESSSEPPDDEQTAFGLGAADVEEYVAAYHDLVLDDPDAAYAQAGPTLRNAIDEQGFREYWGRFEDVEVSDLREEGENTYLATMEFRFPDGARQVEEHRFTFVQNENGQTVLDSDRFVRAL